MTDHNPVLLNKRSYELEVTRPVWLPYNEIAHDIVAYLVDLLGYPARECELVQEYKCEAYGLGGRGADLGVSETLCMSVSPCGFEVVRQNWTAC